MATYGVISAAAVAAAAVCLGSGCSTWGYYVQSVQGHVSLMQKARPVLDVIQDSTTPEPLRQRLALSQKMRDFAVSELKLPDNPSYRRYADLQRSAVVWNVVAAPELSLTLKTWCFAVVGCVGYRGYFRQEEANALAAQLKAEGLEVSVYGVPAYSTLGWMNWAGGDPLLNTFIQYPEAELAKMIFHELAHQVLYVDGDTAFNESFATAVERLGLVRWAQAQGLGGTREEQAVQEARRQDFRELTRRARARLEAVYSGPANEADKRIQKQAELATFRREYQTLKTERWAGFAGYDAWVTQANNAAFAMQGAYNDQVVDFERLYAQAGGDFAAFYAKVKALAALPKAERQVALQNPKP
jgi:predicted aminopeptidase